MVSPALLSPEPERRRVSDSRGVCGSSSWSMFGLAFPLAPALPLSEAFLAFLLSRDSSSFESGLVKMSPYRPPPLAPVFYFGVDLRPLELAPAPAPLPGEDLRPEEAVGEPRPLALAAGFFGGMDIFFY